jgi:hypothetical protein
MTQTSKRRKWQEGTSKKNISTVLEDGLKLCKKKLRTRNKT